MATMRGKNCTHATRLALATVLFTLSGIVQTRADIPISFVAQWGGPSRAVDVVGTTAYVAMGYKLVILDVSSPATPVLLGQTDFLPDQIMAITVAGNYAFIADAWAGLRVIDVTDPASPIPAGSFDTAGCSTGVFLAGDLAYVADGENGLEIIDVTDPTAPVRKGGVDTSGNARQVQVVGATAYVADGPGGLQVIDVTDPENPSVVDHIALADEASGVVVADGNAYVADGYTGGLQIVDVTAPGALRVLGSCGTDGSANDIVVSGSYAYVANAWAGLAIIDITIPASPSKIGQGGGGGWANDIALISGRAYLADWAQGLQIIDVSTPPDAVWLGEYRKSSGEVTGVEVSGDRLYISDGGGGGGAEVLDISTPSDPVRLGGAATHEFAWGLGAEGGFIYLADGCAGMGVVDASDPANTTRRGEISLGCAARDAAVSGSYAYVALDGGHGLRIVDITDPDNPTLVGSWEDTVNPGYALGVAVAGDYVYLADEGQGLQVINVADVANPTRVNQVALNGAARDVAIGGGYAYVATYAGLEVLDLTDPANPVWVGVCTEFNDSSGVALAGRYVYVAAGGAGVQLVDVSNPAEPIRVGQYDTVGFAYRVAAAGNLVYVADYINGVVILTAPVHDYYWINPGDGDFAEPGNWSPLGPPGSVDRAIFDLAGVHTATMSAGADVANDQLLVNDGEVWIDLNSRTWSLTHAWDGAPSVAVGDDQTRATDTHLVVWNGEVNAKELELGRWNNNRATLNIANMTWNADGSFFDIGVLGEGTVTLDHAIAVHRYGGLGSQPGSVGTLAILGDQADWQVWDDLFVGREGTGNLLVESLGASHVGRCTLGMLAGGSGTATIQTGGRLEVTSSNEVSFTLAKAGQGTLTVRDGGQVRNAGMFHIADEPGSVGYLKISNETGSGGEVTSDYQMVLGANASEATVDVDGVGSLLTVSGRDPNNPGDYVSLELGRSAGHGILNVRNGGQVLVPYGGAIGTGIVSIGGTGPGELTVDGDGSLFDAKHVLEVGRDGQGTVIIRNGGALTMSGLGPDGGYAWIGMHAPGEVSVAGLNSRFSLNSQMTVGGGHQGTLTVEDQATVSCSTFVVGDSAEPAADGLVTVTGAGSSLSTGLCRIANQGPGQVMVSDGATLTDSSQVQVGYQAHGIFDIATGGHVISYKGASATQSSAILGWQTGSLGEMNVSDPGSTWIQDGYLNAGWSGEGRLTVGNGGVVESMGGILARVAGGVGVVAVKNSNSKWTMTGSLSVGGLMDSAGGTGTLNISDSGLVTAGTDIRVWPGSAINLGGGRAMVGTGAVPVAAGTLAIQDGGTLSGGGILTGNVVNAAGVVSPGASAGTLHISGEFTQSSTGALHVEIGGTSVGQFDQLDVTGNAGLSGALRISITSGFTPASGNTFEILRSAVRSGAFTEVTGQCAAPGLRFLPTYTATSVILVVAPTVPADFDQDGDVDQADLTLLTACSSGPAIRYATGCVTRDLDQDGDVDQVDFGRFQRCWSGLLPADPNCAD